MKKLFNSLTALTVLCGFASLGAACGTGSCRPKCERPKCEKSCAPKTHCTEKKIIEQRPCSRLVRVEGTCPWERCIKTCTTESQSTRCAGPCNASCATDAQANEHQEVNVEVNVDENKARASRRHERRANRANRKGRY